MQYTLPSIRIGSLCLMAWLVISPLLMEASQALPVARLRNVKPTVQVQVSRSRNFVAVKERQAVNFGDIIRTAKNGKAEVLFSNGTRVAMNGGSQIQIESPETKSSPLVIRVFGALSEVFVRPKGNTQVKTAAAIAAARGTAFLVRLPDENSAIVTVTEDSVDFFNDAGRVLVVAGQQSTARVGTAPTPPVAVDASGELAWTAQITGLPVEYETVAAAADETRLQQLRIQTGLTPDDAAPWLALGDALRARGDAAGASSAYRRVLQIDAAHSSAKIGLALAALSLDDHDGARSALQPIAGEAPAQAVLGLIALQNGSHAEANRFLSAAVEAAPELYQAHALLALTQLTQNQLVAAQQSARRAVALAPESSQAQGTLGMVLFFSGRPHEREAERAAHRAVDLNPLSPFALLVQGRVLLAGGEPDDAMQAFAQAAALMPHLEVAQRELGAAYLRQDRPQSAERAYRQALAINPDSAEAQTGLGVALLRLGRVAEARAAQERALQLDAGNATTRVNYASLLIQEGRLDEARLQLEQGVIADPARGLLYAQLSELSLYRQRLVDALSFARRGVGLLPNSALTHYQLGRVYLELDRGAQAVQHFRRAVLLDRDFAEARYALGHAQEIVETGRDPSRPAASAGAGALNSVARAMNIQNLQTPGAEHRIQALAQDATSLRTASRSYGDTEIEGVGGEDGLRSGSISHLRLWGKRRGVLGVTGEHESQGRINDRENSDNSTDRLGLVIGKKASNNPSSLFAIAQYERLEEGENVGDQPEFLVLNSRVQARKPRLIIGGNWQRSDDNRTRAILQYVAPRAELNNPLFGDRQDDQVDSLNAELRHDRRLGRKHSLSMGIFAGKREREIELFLAGFPPFFPDIVLNNDIAYRVYGAYIRDEFQASSKLRLIGELKSQRIGLTNQFQSTDSLFLPPTFTQMERTNVIPTFIADYQITNQTGVRLRLRRLAGGVRDFQLLSPTDTFLSPVNDLPVVGWGSSGESIELEGDHTFRNGSFLRTGIFLQSLRDAVEPTADGSGAILPRVRVQGARIGYEGNLGRDFSFFLNGGYNHARQQGSNAVVANVPRWTGEAGLQYLNDKGWLIQPSLFMQSSQIRSDRSRADSFTVVNLRAGKRFGLRGTVYVEVRNVFDQQFDILEIEQPGRQLRLGVAGRF